MVFRIVQLSEGYDVTAGSVGGTNETRIIECNTQKDHKEADLDTKIQVYGGGGCDNTEKPTQV